MEGDFIKLNKWLFPLSWLYGMGVRLRNTMFDIGILKERTFSIPVISVGNITVGGTGKTPHVEYLVEMLSPHCNVAVLSHGYKRKSKGFIKATVDTPMTDIGDEPYQMKQKFPNVTIAVDKDRCHGIDLLTADDERLDVVLLDDAFQHRYVKPGVNILLVDYHRLVIYDRLLPVGRLREPLSGKDRADIVIVTKCPSDLTPMQYRVITKAMDLYPYQRLYFTTISYGQLRPLFSDATEEVTHDALKNLNTLLLTGIGSPEQMQHDLAPRCLTVTPLTFSDHHNFNAKDVTRINDAFAALPVPRIILTTEKDATRLSGVEGLSDDVRRSLYVAPIEIRFMLEKEYTFNNQILDYVHKNSRHSILVKAKDDFKPQNGNHSGDRPRTISFRNN